MYQDFEQVQASLAYIEKQLEGQANFKPRFGFILGTGLGNLAKQIEAIAEIPYAKLPHFPTSTVQSHAGKLIFGYLAGQPVVALAGRFHYYEGYTLRETTYPIRVLKALGIERLFISSAVGSVREEMKAGDIVLIRDHINLLPDNPLRGPNDERFGPRFPDMLRAYDQDFNQKALALGRRLGLSLHLGVYVALAGPNLETPAEYQFMQTIGADVVGMSTVPEVLVARHMELPVFVSTVVSNAAMPLSALAETSVEMVIATVEAAEPKLSSLIIALLKDL